MGVLYTALIGFDCIFAFVARKGFLYTYTYVGLSVLLVSTDRAMRRPTNRGTGDRLGSTLFAFASVNIFSSTKESVDYIC